MSESTSIKGFDLAAEFLVVLVRLPSLDSTVLYDSGRVSDSFSIDGLALEAVLVEVIGDGTVCGAGLWPLGDVQALEGESGRTSIRGLVKGLALLVDDLAFS